VQRAGVVRDELLVAARDPGEIADAGRLAFAKRDRDRKPRRMGDRLRPGSPALELARVRQSLPDSLGLRKIEAEEVAGVAVGHADILTPVRTSGCLAALDQ